MNDNKNELTEVEQLRADKKFYKDLLDEMTGLARAQQDLIRIYEASVDYSLLDQVADAREIIERAINIMTHEQVEAWKGARAWLEATGGEE